MTSNLDLLDAMQDPSGMPHLMQHLWDRYCDYLQETMQERHAAVPLETAKKKATASAFLVWASNYLQENAVTDSFYVEGNLGIKLGDGSVVTVSPGNEQAQAGRMQQTETVAVTEGKGQPGKSGTVAKTIIRI